MSQSVLYIPATVSKVTNNCDFSMLCNIASYTVAYAIFLNLKDGYVLRKPIWYIGIIKGA